MVLWSDTVKTICGFSSRIKVQGGRRANSVLTRKGTVGVVPLFEVEGEEASRLSMRLSEVDEVVA